AQPSPEQELREYHPLLHFRSAPSMRLTRIMKTNSWLLLLVLLGALLLGSANGNNNNNNNDINNDISNMNDDDRNSSTKDMVPAGTEEESTIGTAAATVP
ncbi:unnamed protein product, partial [Ectocarpus sp. 12 AP-2014]